MKKLQSLLLATLILLLGCGEINDSLDALEGRVNDIENTQIATISQQITSINNSILLLNNTDKELDSYITALEAEAENLQTQITATNAKIDEVKTEVISTISSEKANILAKLEALRNTTTARLEEINTTITELQATDGDMSAQIEALEAEATQLEAKLAETNTKIDTLKNELTETISTEKANILAELEAFKATVNGELDAIKAVLETLKAKDVELDSKIALLQEYVDAELKAAEDWTTATFATLEQYNEVISTIATIESTIEGLNESISALETRINEKIAKDIETACATLSADLQNAVKEVTKAYTSTIATAKNELTEAYTSTLEGSISVLETSMKMWVNEQLTAYSTIVSTEAKITALQSEIDGKLAAQKTYLEALVNALSSSVTTDITAIKKQIKNIEDAIAKNAEEIMVLRGELAKQKVELTKAYTEAIATAKDDMSKELSAEIAAINERIDKSNITAIEALIANCKTRMETAEAEIVQLKSDVLQLQIDVEGLQEITEKLLRQIQSITYIPTYDDGKATIDYHSKRGTLDFQISPKSAIVELEKVWQTVLSFKAVHTQTRTVDFINLPITSFKADTSNGTITIEVDGTNLSENFFVEKITASATLEVSDGNNYINSPYTNLTANYIIRFADKEVERICVANWDTNYDGRLSYEEAAQVYRLYHVFKDNIYIHTFNELSFFTNITEVESDAFKNCTRLHQITLPNNCISTGSYSFGGCINLAQITIPNNFKKFGFESFEGCVSLKEIHIPNMETWCNIEFGSENSNPLYYTHNLYLNKTLVTDIIIPNNITSINNTAFAYCTSVANVIIPDCVLSIGYDAFYKSSLVNITIGNGVTSIGYNAFYSCLLTNVTLPQNISSIGSCAFTGCSKLKKIYCKASTPPTGGVNMFSLNAPDRKIYVPIESVEAYKRAEYWCDYADCIVGYDF